MLNCAPVYVPVHNQSLDYYGKMMKEAIEGSIHDLCPNSEHISSGKYVDEKVKEQEESEREARKEKGRQLRVLLPSP